MHLSFRLAAMLFALMLVLVPSTVQADEAAFAEPKHEVKIVPDIDYYTGKDFDKQKHKLDLYLPKDKKEFPVLFFVHGGGWRTGDKDYFGVYSAVGRFYARRGIGTVVTNYRLTPQVMHPEHVKDVARAFAWTYRNITKHGGRADQIFTCGHSAGGHLVALLATDAKYLESEGISGDDAIRGVIPISGVFDVPRFLTRVFSKDPAVRKEASPISHVKENLPPFLILYADKDLPNCGGLTAETFKKALIGKLNKAESKEIEKSNHFKIILSVSVKDDPVSDAILGFIAATVKK